MGELPEKRGQIYFSTRLSILFSISLHKIRSFVAQFTLERSEGLRTGRQSTVPAGAIYGSINKSVPFLPYSPIDDWGEKEWLHAATRNPALDFLKEAEEDIYLLSD
ncbi:MAG: hypothetical protein NTV33_09855, partial [Coprothermobacterota bacterium]|nr:hypothetical protein [Coprothermobacterota bacterium]